jgi:hypothetical protein
MIWPIQLAFLLFTVCRYSSSPWLYAILLHFSHDQCNWSPFFFSTAFQSFQVIYDLLSEVFKSVDTLLIFFINSLSNEAVHSSVCTVSLAWWVVKDKLGSIRNGTGVKLSRCYSIIWQEVSRKTKEKLSWVKPFPASIFEHSTSRIHVYDVTCSVLASQCHYNIRLLSST